MTYVADDRLYDLLPDVYRLRDADAGSPLRELLRVVAEQVDLVEDDIRRLYANWFVETCDEWVVPYIGDLLGVTMIRPVTGGGRSYSSRREVAATIASRRRKGTLALLEDLSVNVAGWPARAVEFYALLCVNQHLDRLRPERGGTVDIRHGEALDRIDGPFDESSHLVSVPRISGRRTTSRHNIPSVGVFVWRLKPYSITRAPAYCDDRARSHFHFSVLGNDLPLVTNPVDEPDRHHIADESNVPGAISRRAFEDRTADFYGAGKSLQIWRNDLDHPVPLADIVATDLSGWAYRPVGNQVAVDPVLGRIAFSPGDAPEEGVWVTYHYAFSDDTGGGEYLRPVRPNGARTVYRVGPGETHERIMDAVGAWRADTEADPKHHDAVIEITDSGEYQEPIALDLRHEDRLELRAAQGRRPLIRILDRYSNRPDSLRVRGLPPEDGAEPPGHDGCDAGGPRLVLDGLLISNRSVRVTGPVGRVTVRHSTLVPGWSIGDHCEPEHEEEPSLVLDRTSATVLVERSILGTIVVNADEVGTDPLDIRITDSILDATSPDLDAMTGTGDRFAHATLSVVRSTVFGRIRTHAIALAENSILDGRVRVVRRQIGCARFCSIGAGSRTPRRYHCQPDLVSAAVEALFEEGDIDAAERGLAIAREQLRVQPRFESRRYGTQTYAQLGHGCAAEITGGADDDGEMGAFHELFQPQRRANLQARLDEYSPIGFGAGIIYVT